MTCIPVRNRCTLDGTVLWSTAHLTVDTSLLDFIGEPEDPVIAWKKLANQFEKKTWTTRLDLRRKLHSLRLKDGELAQ